MAAAYSASKAAVIGMTKSFGKDLATTGVLVNAVAPAVIATPMLSQMSQEHIDYMVEKIPMGRLGPAGGGRGAHRVPGERADDVLDRRDVRHLGRPGNVLGACPPRWPTALTAALTPAPDPLTAQRRSSARRSVWTGCRWRGSTTGGGRFEIVATDGAELLAAGVRAAGRRRARTSSRPRAGEEFVGARLRAVARVRPAARRGRRGGGVPGRRLGAGARRRAHRRCDLLLARRAAAGHARSGARPRGDRADARAALRAAPAPVAAPAQPARARAARARSRPGCASSRSRWRSGSPRRPRRPTAATSSASSRSPRARRRCTPRACCASSERAMAGPGPQVTLGARSIHERRRHGSRGEGPRSGRHRAGHELPRPRAGSRAQAAGADVRVPHPRRRGAGRGRHGLQRAVDHGQSRHAGLVARRTGDGGPARAPRPEDGGRALRAAHPSAHRPRRLRLALPDGRDDRRHQPPRAGVLGVRPDGRAVPRALHEAPRRPLAPPGRAAAPGPRRRGRGGDHPRRPRAGGGWAHRGVDERPRRDRRGRREHLRRRASTTSSSSSSTATCR